MAVSSANYHKSNNRFSLLLLEDSEVLFEGAACVCESKSVDMTIETEGRLYVSSRSLVFDPRKLAYPVQYFRLVDIAKKPKLIRSREVYLSLNVEQYKVMKVEGASTPYGTIKRSTQLAFQFLHRELSEDNALFNLIIHLWELNRLSVKEREKGVNEIVNKRLSSPFDLSRLTSFREKVLTPKHVEVCLIQKLIDIPGCLIITDKRLYFQPAEINNVGEAVKSYQIRYLHSLYKRRHMLRHNGLEVCFKGPKEETSVLLFAFIKGHRQRDEIFAILNSHDMYLPEKARLRKEEGRSIIDFTKKWQKREISNYEYLSRINAFADRSMNDLTQYPVFPWVVKDYESHNLDLSADATFRDLTKPVGALNEVRLQGYLERFYHLQNDNDKEIPPFIYGTHYSTPGYVLYYLVRSCPDLMLRLQNGKFDDPDRCFHSISDTWDSVLNNPADIKELIPEFYDSDGEFLVNSRKLGLGNKQNGEIVDDVKLPPWAKSPKDFVLKCREALESEFVSQRLHHWIDLIFGYKQRGDEAIKSNNLYYYLTYEGAVDIDQIEDYDERKSIQAQIYEFGQTPKQIFTSPHPSRNAPFSGEREENSSEAAKALGKSEVAHLSKDSTSIANGIFQGNQTHDLIARESSSDLLIAKTCSDLNFGNEIVCLKAHRKQVEDLCFAEGDSTLYSGEISTSNEKGAKLVPVVSRDSFLSMLELKATTIKHRTSLSKLALSSCEVLPSTSVVVIGSWDNSIYFYDVEFGKLSSKLLGHEDAISGYQVQKITLFDSAFVEISIAKYRPQIVGSASWDSSVKIWDSTKITETKEPMVAYYDHESAVTALNLNEKGTLVASASDEGQLVIRDLRSNEPVYIFDNPDKQCKSICVSWLRSDNALLRCSNDGTLQIFDMHKLSNLPSLEAGYLAGNGVVSTCSLTRDKQCAIIGDAAGRMVVADVSSFSSLESTSFKQVKISEESPITAISCTESQVALGTGLGLVKVLQLQSESGSRFR